MRISDWSSDVCSSDLTSHTFSSLLLLTSALIAPSAIAQTSEQADPAPATTTPPPAEEQPVDVSVPGASFDGEIVVTGRFIPNIVRSTPQVVSVLSNEDDRKVVV